MRIQNPAAKIHGNEGANALETKHESRLSVTIHRDWVWLQPTYRCATRPRVLGTNGQYIFVSIWINHNAKIHSELKAKHLIWKMIRFVQSKQILTTQFYVFLSIRVRYSEIFRAYLFQKHFKHKRVYFSMAGFKPLVGLHTLGTTATVLKNSQAVSSAKLFCESRIHWLCLSFPVFNRAV